MEENGGIYAFFPESMLWVEVTHLSPLPEQNWRYEADAFLPPAPPIRTPEETLANNTARRDGCLGLAAAAIAPLQDAEDLEDATPAEATLLKKWKQYRVALSRMDMTAETWNWPEAPQ